MFVVMYSIAPICFSTSYCGGESISDGPLSFYQCCFELSGASLVSSGQCLMCPQGIAKYKYLLNVFSYITVFYFCITDLRSCYNSILRIANLNIKLHM